MLYEEDVEYVKDLVLLRAEEIDGAHRPSWLACFRMNDKTLPDAMNDVSGWYGLHGTQFVTMATSAGEDTGQGRGTITIAWNDWDGAHIVAFEDGWVYDPYLEAPMKWAEWWAGVEPRVRASKVTRQEAK